MRNAGDLTLVGLAKAMNRQIEKARGGKLTLDDLSGGTYSISNNGAFGTTFTAPIINAPQVAHSVDRRDQAEARRRLDAAGRFRRRRA